MSSPQVENIYRLSFLQEGLLFHSVEDPEAAFYVDQVVYRLTGELDLGLFTRAWELVTERHAVLRTSFHWQGVSELVQVVHGEAGITVESLDWQAKSPVARDAELESFLRADRLSGFDLDRPPLIRLTVIDWSPGEYRFVFRYHHMLIDAWSGLMVLNEAFGYYDELAAGRTPEVRPARSFHDYVSWVREQDLGAAERFWRQALAGISEPTPIPIIRPADAAALPDGGRDNPEQTRRIPATTVHRLQQIARENQLTVGALLQTCWALLLGRYAGRDEVVFGGTMSSRPAELPGVEETAGLFISTLPVRVRLDPDESVIETCRRLQADQAELRQYDFSPLAQVQQWSPVPAGSALFDSIMTVLNVPGIGALEERDGAVRLSDGGYRYRTNYPLSLLVIPQADGDFTLRVGYAPDRVRTEDVVRLLGHLATIVTAVASSASSASSAAGGLRVADVPMLSQAELDELETWSGRSVPADDRLAPDLIAGAGTAVAVRHQTGELTYDELERRANRLAHHLRSSGVRPDSVVGLCLPRSDHQIVAMLAILKAGGCFLPLDPAQPEARLTAIIAEADVKVLVTDRDRRARLPRTGGRTVLVDAHHDRIAACSDERPESMIGPDNLAYVIYTSGSTGKPKGVMVTHRGLANLLRSQARHFGLGPADRVLQWAAATFDASVFDVMLALGAGATLQVADEDRVAPGRDLADLLRTERITALTITPSALAATAPEPLPDLRLLVLAGEALPADLVAKWGQGRRIVNAYGPTEATVWVTAADVSPDDEGTPPIGTPVDNHVVRVLDPAGRPVPIGLPGELYVGGVALARGYLAQPDQTAARFGPDPFRPDGRLYRTGDVVRWRADGQLEFVGRQDRQLKIRGFRIEAGEVEAALRALPGVTDCAVVAQASPGVELPDTLAAYVVLTDPAPATSELRDHLGKVLPPYLVPSVILGIDRLPLTSNGKLDEAALPTVAEAAAAQSGGRVPSSMAEKAVAALWGEILGAEVVGLDDDFFALGGNSIKATQVVSRVRRAWQIELPLRSVFETRTVEKFAVLLEEALAE